MASLAASLLAPACAPSHPEPEEPEPLRAESQGTESPPPSLVATEQASGTTARLQAVSVVDESVVWASGLEGTFAATSDGGENWTSTRMTGAEDLQFRDVHAFSARVAYLLAAGEGEASRIYKTVDGGKTWTLQFLNQEPEGFLDCFDFWDEENGVAYGDSVGGVLFVLTTEDGGETWSQVPPESLPAAGEGEGGFAASGTCVEVAPGGRAWIATGAGGNARVLRTKDRGATWSAADLPTVKGDAAGLMSVFAWLDSEGSAHRLVALGGDLGQPDAVTANVAISDDGGATWSSGGELTFAGAAYGGAFSPGVAAASSGTAAGIGGSADGDQAGAPPLLVAVGPGGLGLSVNGGETWTDAGAENANYWAAEFGDADTIWAVGPEGRITRFEVVR